MTKIANNIFAIRPINEEQNEFIVTIGRHLATENHFKSEEEADNYIKSGPWDMIVALVAEMIEISKEKEDVKSVMINNGINKKVQK